MHVATMDTGGISYSGIEYLALAATESEARLLVARKWRERNGEAEMNAIGVSDVVDDVETISDEALAEVLSEYYGIQTVSVKKGECIIG